MQEEEEKGELKQDEPLAETKDTIKDEFGVIPTNVAPILDEDGFLMNGYDVVICGTGIVQSILASAFTRAGKSVLHVDGNSFYGETEAVFTLSSLLDHPLPLYPESQLQPFPTRQNETPNVHDPNHIHIHPRGAFSSFQIHSATYLPQGNHSASSRPSHVLQIGMQVMTPYGPGIVEHFPEVIPKKEERESETDHDTVSFQNSLVIRLNTWTMAHGQSPCVYLAPPPPSSPTSCCTKNSMSFFFTQYYATHENIHSISYLQYQQLLHPSYARSFLIDLSPSLLLAHGDAVEGIVQSSVSDYCEFKNLIGLYYWKEKDDPKKKTKNKEEEETVSYALSKVPCSKGEIFQTKLMSPIEKRKLMKFLQLALDFSVSMTPKTDSTKSDDCHENHPVNPTTRINTKDTKEEGPSSLLPTNDSTSSTIHTSLPNTLREETVTSLNERELQQGRSLYRPQNKILNTHDFDILQKAIQDNMDFDTYLESKQNLPKHLRDIVMYAMALRTSSYDGYSTGQGMYDLSKHLLSLGRYGNTAFLVPMYGSGEINQAFCRCAAVHGGTYLLRRQPKAILLKEDSTSIQGILLYPESDGNTNSSDDRNTHSSDDRNTSSSENVVGDETTIQKEKFIQAKCVVLASNSIDPSFFDVRQTGRQEPHRIFRRVSILRNKLIAEGNDPRHSEQRHVIIIPPNVFGNENVIRGVILDESAHLAPWSVGGEFSCCIMHLTTLAKETNGCSDTMDGSLILERAAHTLIESQSKDRDDYCTVDELYHFSFSYSVTCSDDFFPKSELPSGLYVCSCQNQSLTVEEAFLEAKAIFENCCPDVPFLSLSSEMNAIIQERRVGMESSEDDDGVILQNAMDVIDTANSVK